jgi:prolyl-tRNA synthetase
MRMSRLFYESLREAPSEAQTASHQLLLRAGFIRPLAAGIYSELPLARKSMTKLEYLIRQEIEAIGGQEIRMPIAQPAELWQESNRYYEIDEELKRFTDRTGREFVLAMTHEEVAGDLTRKLIHSYRQLPVLFYQIQTKWRDDPRPRSGLLRTREFTMKDSYSLDTDWEGLEKQYRAHYQAYFNIFHRCDLDVMAIAADTGIMGGKLAHEFIVLSEIGEDTVLICDACGYRANRQIATFMKQTSPRENPASLEKVATPDCKTIEEVSRYLDMPAAKTAKAVFLVTTLIKNHEPEQKTIFAVLRGDMELNETKLKNLLDATSLRPATEDEIIEIGAVPGYASPIGLKTALVVVDDLIPDSQNLVAGANQEGYHFKNVNYGRDYSADFVADIAAAQDGDACPNCKSAMRAERAIEVGHIFQLGTHYSEGLRAMYQDEDGEQMPVIMGSYGIGIGRLLGMIAQTHHDEHGLCWPISAAPYHVQFIYLESRKGGNHLELADSIYTRITQAGIEVLFDDRLLSAGVKFTDADLIGIPLRLTLSDRSLQQGGLEIKHRDTGSIEIIPVETIIEYLSEQIATMQADLQNRVVNVPYRE